MADPPTPPTPPANDPPTPPTPPANDPPTPPTPPTPPANDPPKPPEGDRLSVVEKSLETLTALVTKLIPPEDKKPTRKPWTSWGSRS